MPIDLSNIRIWLSCSLPEQQPSNDLREFLRAFSCQVYQHSGQLLHGDPRITPILAEAAHDFQDRNPQPLTLAASRYFPQAWSDLSPQDQQVTRLHWTPKAEANGEMTDRQRSVQWLRDWLAAQADVVVAVGGKERTVGVPVEIRLAKQRETPCFVLGGLGGATDELLQQEPQWLTQLQNGWDEQANREAAQMRDAVGLTQRLIEQIHRLPLRRRERVEELPFRILALDGGGIRGAFTAAVLAEWERELEKRHGHSIRLVDHFDLITGTSTGGILALGLGAGLTSRELLEFYQKNGPRIFPMKWFLQRWMRGVRSMFIPKFSSRTLRRELENAFEKTRCEQLRQAESRLLIPVYNQSSNAPVLYRSWDDRNGQRKILDLALATAAAPTYFASHKMPTQASTYQAIDGGVWANCPALAATVEAVRKLAIPLDRIRVLSVGTTYSPHRMRAPWLSGALGWAAPISSFLMKTQEQGDIEFARQLLGENFLRVDCPLEVGGLDDVNSIPQLVLEGERLAQQHTQDAQQYLDGTRAEPW